VFTLPTPANGTQQGSYRLQLETAAAGGPTTIVREWQSQGNDQSNLGFTDFAVVGWDAGGPIAEVGAGGIGTQNAWLDGQRWFTGWLGRVGSDGSLSSRIGPDCLPFWRPVNGRFACTSSDNSSTSVQVVDLKGHVLWSSAAEAASGVTGGAFYLSPDGTKLASTRGILTSDGATRRLSAGFRPQGWVDKGTIIGWIPSGQSNGGVPGEVVAVFHLDTGQLENWGFAGTFVGTVR
jgi:hypothetical protein